MSISQKQKLPYLKTVNLGYKYKLYPTLKRGLESFGLGTSLIDLKHKAFRSETLVSAS